MIRRPAVAGLLLALALVPGAHPALAQEYKQYCVVTTTPTAAQPPMVCVVDPTSSEDL
jgi:hypothetical protein